MITPTPEPPVAVELPPSTPPRSINWRWFTLALLLPPILTFATALAGWKDFPAACPFIGGGITGLVCGILLARRLGRTMATIVLLSILFGLVFAMLSFALCFGGCMLGGYQVNL